MATLEPLMERNFLEYASYVIVDRAIPDIRDGCKPVQRRILATLGGMDDGKFHKVANVIGETMKLHPHGDASIGDALVVLANKEYFIEKQGNFGNLITGHPAAASRYIECRLTELARETLFNDEITEFHKSYDGRKDEPDYLPAKLPVLLMLGTEGIAVGMSTKILPHNFTELLKAQIDILKYLPVQLTPDFPTGGTVDITEYEDGKGKVKVRAKMESDGDKRIVITEIAHGTNTESLIASIENAAQKNKIKIASINDFTTDHVEIEIILPRGVYADDVIPQLYAYTDCEVSISSNMVTIRDGHPIQTTVSAALEHHTNRLRDQIAAELTLKLRKLADKQHWLTLEQLFIENRVYKKIESAKTADAVNKAVYKGMEPFSDQMIRPLTDDDVGRLLEIRIRRISAFDIEKNRRQISEVKDEIVATEAKLAKLTETTIAFIEHLIAKYGEKYPRRTEIDTFQTVDRRTVAEQNIKVAYDPESGFFGTEVKNGSYQMTISEYDKVLIVTKDGVFRIVGPTNKMLIPGKVLYCDRFDVDEGVKFTVVYRDKTRTAYAKKVHILKFIHAKEYELIKDRAGSIDYLLGGDAQATIKLHFVPAKRQRVTEFDFDLADIDFIGVSARGSRMAAKPVARMKKLAAEQNGNGNAEPATPSEAPEPPTNTSGSGQQTLF